MTEKISAFEITKALGKRHANREFFITECKSGPTVTGLLQFDAVAIYKSWSRPQIRGYEIKVNRSDFLRDAKYPRYLPYFHEFYFVTPAGMVQRQEVEENIGLIWYNPKTERLTTKRKAVYRDIEVNADMLLYIIMNRLDSDRLPYTSDKAEYWRDWVNNKISNRELGYHVRSKLLRKIEEQEHDLRRFRDNKEDKEELEAIDKVMQKHGLQTYWSRAEKLDEALEKGYPKELDRLQQRLQEAVTSIESLKEVYPG